MTLTIILISWYAVGLLGCFLGEWLDYKQNFLPNTTWQFTLTDLFRDLAIALLGIVVPLVVIIGNGSYIFQSFSNIVLFEKNGKQKQEKLEQQPKKKGFFSKDENENKFIL